MIDQVASHPSRQEDVLLLLRVLRVNGYRLVKTGVGYIADRLSARTQSNLSTREKLSIEGEKRENHSVEGKEREALLEGEKRR